MVEKVHEFYGRLLKKYRFKKIKDDPVPANRIFELSPNADDKPLSTYLQVMRPITKVVKESVAKKGMDTFCTDKQSDSLHKQISESIVRSLKFLIWNEAANVFRERLDEEFVAAKNDYEKRAASMGKKLDGKEVIQAESTEEEQLDKKFSVANLSDKSTSIQKSLLRKLNLDLNTERVVKNKISAAMTEVISDARNLERKNDMITAREIADTIHAKLSTLINMERRKHLKNHVVNILTKK